jgi:hypothetical protein
VQRLTLDNLDGMTGLAGLADRSGIDIRPTLLRVLTDLYIQKPAHSPAEDRHYTELALRLIEMVDEATCAVVAERLKGHPNAPAAVLERLAHVAPRMANEKDLGSIELFINETSLDDDLGIFEPVAPTASQCAPERVSPAAAAMPLPVDYIAQREAFFSAEAEDRKLILLNLDPVAEQDVALAQETNIIRYLEQAALAGRAQEFTTLLQQSLGVSRALSRRIVTDPLGEPFVVSAKALAMPTDVFQRILMSLNPAIGQSVDRVFELSDLFMDLPLSSAVHLVAIWRAADRMEARSLVHHRAHWDDAVLATRQYAAHAPRRTDAVTTADHDPLRRESSRG